MSYALSIAPWNSEVREFSFFSFSCKLMWSKYHHQSQSKTILIDSWRCWAIQMDVIRSHNITIIWFHFSFLLVYHLFKTKHSRCSLTFLNVNIIFSHNLRFHFGVMPAKMRRNLDIDSKNCEWACFRCIKIRRIVSGARSHKPKMKEKTRRRKKTIWQREMVENEMSSNQSRQASL